jgi:O-antigen/teichoic acid export membrane protein
MTASTARRLLGGSALRAISLAVGVFVSFYMVPFLVGILGDRWYGYWVLCGTIVGYYVAIDLGLTAAIHRFLAMAHGRNDREQANRVFNTALVLTGGVGLAAGVIALIAWLLVGWVVQPADVPTVRLLVLVLGVNFAVGFPVAVYNGILAANLRYDLSSYIQLARLLVRSAIVVVVVSRTRSVVSLAWITLAVDLASNAVTVVVATRLWPWLRVSRTYFERERVREYFGYGFYSFLIRLGDIVRFGLDNVVVGAFLGVARVTHYSIAMRLTESFHGLFSQATSVLTPVFSRYHGANDRVALHNGMRQAARLTAALSASVAGAAIIFGSPFIRRWMGPEYLDAYWPLIVLISASLLNVSQLPSNLYLYAIARHRYYAWLNGFDALANFGLSVILAPRLGMLGVALGTAIPTIVVKTVLQPRYVCGQLGISMTSYWREIVEMMLGSLVLQLPIAAIVWWLQPATYTAIIGLAVVLYGIHLFVVYLFVLRPEDQLILARAVPPLNRLLAMRRRLAGTS